MERRDADLLPDQGAINRPVMLAAGLSALYALDEDGVILQAIGG